MSRSELTLNAEKALRNAIWWQYKIIKWLLYLAQEEQEKQKEICDLIRLESNRLAEKHCVENERRARNEDL